MVQVVCDNPAAVTFGESVDHGVDALLFGDGMDRDAAKLDR